MAKEAYFGVGDVPKKIKSIYFGVGDVPKKVKTGYFGVGDVPKVFFSAEADTVTFNKTLTGGMADCSGGGNEFCALFKQNTSSQGSSTRNAYAYNTSLTKSSLLSVQDVQYGVSIVGNSAYIFAGGGLKTSVSNADTPQSTCFAFDSAYTSTSTNGLGTSGASIGSGRIGNYVVFAGGGSSYSKTITSFNLSLTKMTSYALSKPQKMTTCCALSDYLLVTGGYESGSVNTTAIDAFDSSLTKKSGTLTTSVTRYVLGYNNKYAIAEGTVDGTIAIDSSFTQTFAAALTRANCDGISACGSPGVAIFAGAASNNGSSATYYNNVETFDTSLTKTVVTALPTKIGSPCIVNLNNRYFLMNGGNDGWDSEENSYTNDGYNKLQVYDIS